jgi:hypothetical protein
MACSKIPCSTEQGNFLAEQGIFSSAQGTLSGNNKRHCCTIVLCDGAAILRPGSRWLIGRQEVSVLNQENPASTPGLGGQGEDERHALGLGASRCFHRRNSTLNGNATAPRHPASLLFHDLSLGLPSGSKASHFSLAFCASNGREVCGMRPQGCRPILA